MKLLFVGDVMLGRLVNDLLKNKPTTYPWGDTLAIFKDADFRLVNLECVISDFGQPYSMTPKAFHFRSDAQNVAVLKTASINLVSIANNHILDFEYMAMFEMLKILDREKIVYAGAGMDKDSAQEAAICQAKGIRIGFIAFTDNEPDWEATDKGPGIFYVPVELGDRRAKNLFQIVKKTKEKVDILIVSAHWGPNWDYHPYPSHIPFAYALVNSGADIIFGHSCHVFQGIEIYKGKPILYSCGDFIDDYAVDEIEKNDQSFIFIVETNDNQVANIRLYPTVIGDCQARLAKGDEAEKIALKMKSLCREFNTESTWLPKERYLKITVN